MSRASFVLVAALVACAVAHGQSLTCSLQTACSGCVGNSGCGWAADLSLCYSGTSSGPSPPVTSTNWIWGSSSNCPAASGCSAYGTCSTCNSHSSCFWDGFSCITGPNGGTTCSGSTPGTPTGSCSYTTCATCNSHSSCFWDGFSCVSGSNIGSTCSGSGSSCSSYGSCSSCISNANCAWDSISCIPGSNIGSVCFNDGSLVATTEGLGLHIILIIIFVPVVVFASVTSAVCWWYRRVYMLRRAAVVVTDVGLTAAVTSPYVAVQTGSGINTVVY